MTYAGLCVAVFGLAAFCLWAWRGLEYRMAEERRGQVHDEMRKVGFALHSYAVDNCGANYPAWTLGEDVKSVSHGNPPLAKMPTFLEATIEIRHEEGREDQILYYPQSLTTPVAYLESLPADIFNPRPDRGVATFSFHSSPASFTLISPGPDGDFDIDPLQEIHPDSLPVDIVALYLDATYDPTNGARSHGDLYYLCRKGAVIVSGEIQK